MKKTIAIIGCTGSIGIQAIDVILHHPDYFDLQLITCHQQVDKLQKISSNFSGVQLGLHNSSLFSSPPRDILTGDDEIAEWIISHKTQLVLIASSSLETATILFKILPYVEKVALSSKEVIILSGSLGFITPLWREKIIPVDSEHVAIHQLLRHSNREQIREVILTASGGPFYSKTPHPDLDQITPAMALQHPTWQMGKKVTIDSATLANKGIELLEAYYLFSLQPEQLNVVIHPQSIIHAMVQYQDGSLVAQMAYPDMRLPIAYALFYPQSPDLPYIKRIEANAFPGLSFLSYPATDIPLVRLALDCLRENSLKPLWYIILDEIAVQAFLLQTIRFADIQDFLDFGIQEMDRLFSYQELHTAQTNLSALISLLQQTSQRLLNQYMKQVV